MPPVKAVYGFRIKPARFEDWRALSREGNKVVHRLGGQDSRSFSPMMAGPESTMCFTAIDFVDGAHMGMFFDAAQRDVEVQTLMDRMAGHVDSPSEMLQSSLIREYPSDLPKEQGPVMDVWVSQVHPGRLPDAIEMLGELGPLVIDNGACGAHLYSVDAAGSASGRLVWTAEYTDFEAYGRAHDQVFESPDMMAMLGRLMGADAPTALEQHSVMSEITLH